MSVGILAWAVLELDDEPDRWIPHTLLVFAGMAAASSAWLAYSAYRRPSSLPAIVATGAAYAFSAFVLLAWLWTTVGLSWCYTHRCGD
jgi:hypothetical protein